MAHTGFFDRNHFFICGFFMDKNKLQKAQFSGFDDTDGFRKLNDDA